METFLKFQLLWGRYTNFTIMLQTVTEAGYGWIHFGVVKVEGKLGKNWRSSLELQWVL